MGNQCSSIDHCSRAEVIYDDTGNELFTDVLILHISKTFEFTDRPQEDFVQSAHLKFDLSNDHIVPTSPTTDAKYNYPQPEGSANSGPLASSTKEGYGTIVCKMRD